MKNNITICKKDFPLLVNYPNYCYCDNAATTQKPQQVIDAITHYYTSYNSNVHRGIHKLSEKATDEYEKVREKVAEFIGASSKEIIYSYGTTHSINTLAFGFQHTLSKGDEIVITAMEHHANIVPWQEVCKNTGSFLRVIPITKEGRLDYDKAREVITEKTKILSLSHASNVLGTVNDIKELIEYAKSQNQNCYAFIDGAQEIANSKIDVKELNCDAYSFSAHKLFGPTGVGILYLKQHLFSQITPFLYGGAMIEDVSFESTTYAKGFHKLEAGTPPISSVVGLGEGIEYMNSFNREDIENHKKELTQYFLENSKELGDDFKLYGPQDSLNRNPVFSFTLSQIHPHDLTKFLDEYNIATRSGHHCAIPLHKELGVDGTTRISLTLYNTKEEIDTIINALKEIKNIF